MAKWLPYVLVAFATFFWGSTFILVKATIALIPVNFFLTIRFGLATLILLPVVLIRGKLGNAILWKNGIVLGILLFASYYFQTVGLLYTTPANGAFITGLNIVFIPIFGFLIFGDVVRKEVAFAVILALCGTVLMTLNFSQFSINFGDMIILLTAISIAFHILLTEKYIEHDLIELLGIQFFVMTLCAMILNGTTVPANIEWYTSQTIIITLIVTVIFATVYAFGAQIYAQKQQVSATIIGILFTLEPLFALLIDITVGLIPNLQTLLGMGLIFVAIITVTIVSEQPPQVQEELSNISK